MFKAAQLNISYGIRPKFNWGGWEIKYLGIILIMPKYRTERHIYIN